MAVFPSPPVVLLESAASPFAQVVVASGVEKERVMTDGRVGETSRLLVKSSQTHRSPC